MQISVVVANIPTRPRKTEVEKGLRDSDDLPEGRVVVADERDRRDLVPSSLDELIPAETSENPAPKGVQLSRIAGQRS